MTPRLAPPYYEHDWQTLIRRRWLRRRAVRVLTRCARCGIDTDLRPRPRCQEQQT